MKLSIEFKQKKAGGHLLSRSRSIIGAGELDFRVRNGNGYFLPAMATGIIRAASEAENFASGKYPSRLQSLGGTLSAERNKMIFEGTIWPSLTTY